MVGEFTTHFRTCFSGWIESDVHWGYDLDFDPWQTGLPGAELTTIHWFGAMSSSLALAACLDPSPVIAQRCSTDGRSDWRCGNQSENVFFLLKRSTCGPSSTCTLQLQVLAGVGTAAKKSKGVPCSSPNDVARWSDNPGVAWG